MFLISVLVFSLWKVLYHFTVAKDKCAELQVKQLLRKLRIIVLGICKSQVHVQNSPEFVASKSKDGFRADDMVVDEDSLQVNWEEQYKNLTVENVSLQEQLVRTTYVDKPAVNGKLQTLSESVEYWKRVAKINEQETNKAIQMERKNSARLLEQLKADLIRLVEQERSVLLEEFHSMVVQLRESLITET
jgi:hypothetical protein